MAKRRPLLPHFPLRCYGFSLIVSEMRKKMLIKKKQQKKKLKKKKHKMLMKREAEQATASSSMDEEIPNQMITIAKYNFHLSAEERSDELNLFVKLSPILIKGCRRSGWISFSTIQKQMIGAIFNYDYSNLVAVAPRSTGLTGSYIIPILNQICLEKSLPDHVFACILCPSADRARSVVSLIHKIGFYIKGLKCVYISLHSYGYEDGTGVGIDVAHQLLSLSFLPPIPHIVVGSPSQIHYIISNIAGVKSKFSSLKFFVLDSADVLLGTLDSVSNCSLVMKEIPNEAKMYLVSRMETKAVQEQDIYRVAKHEGSILRCGASEEPSHEYFVGNASETLIRLLYLLDTSPSNALVCTQDCKITRRMRPIFDSLVPYVAFVESSMSLQQQQIELDKLRDQKCKVLVCSDSIIGDNYWVLPTMATVINFGLPHAKTHHMAYFIRKEFTGRAGLGGKIVSFVDKESKKFLVAAEGEGITELSVDAGLLHLYKGQTRSAKLLETLDRRNIPAALSQSGDGSDGSKTLERRNNLATFSQSGDGSDGNGSKDDEEKDMKATFHTILEDISKHILEKKKDKESDFYLRKKSEKRKAKKKRVKNSSEIESSDSGLQAPGQPDDCC